MTLSDRTSFFILSTMLYLVAFGCSSPNKGPIESRLEGSWKEDDGRMVFWTLGLFPMKSSVRELGEGFEDPCIFTFRKDGSVDWSRSKGFLGEPDWTLSTKGDRTTADGLDGPAEYLEMTDAHIKPNSTRIEIRQFPAACKLNGKIKLAAVLNRDNRLRVRIVFCNPMGMKFHQEYIGRFARKKD